MSAREVVARLQDGMTLGIGGWAARRKPMALVREIARSALKDLTVVSYGGPDVGVLCAAGKIKRLIYGFVTLDTIPLDPHFRNARQSGALEVAAPGIDRARARQVGRPDPVPEIVEHRAQPVRLAGAVGLCFREPMHPGRLEQAVHHA